MSLSPVSEACRRKNSLAVAVSQTTYTLVVRHAVSVCCAREKSIEHCIDCADYPCKSYRTWQTVAKLLPHLHGTAASLNNIKFEGADHWLNVQKNRWSCPDCGTSFSWYATACYKCGRSLASKAHELSGWRKLLCRFMLTMAYRKGRAENKIV
jgi:hypothetical protein